MNKIAGYCPMGCGQTLFLGSGGHVTCSYIPCRNPTAVDELLDERESEHIVTIDDNGLTIRHPLRERIADELEECRLTTFMERLDGLPLRTGRYRAHRIPNDPRQWSFVPAKSTPTADPELCATCGCDLRYPTAPHVLDCSQTDPVPTDPAPNDMPRKPAHNPGQPGIGGGVYPGVPNRPTTPPTPKALAEASPDLPEEGNTQ